MFIFKKQKDLREFLDGQTGSIGFVPTMGALHEGHISLLQTSKQSCDLSVCSIFVNPTQFNDPKDFEKYPVTIDEDIRLLSEAGTDVLFLPDVAEMYPDGLNGLTAFDIGELDLILEGQFRPGHFNGVCQIVYRLLTAVRPTHLFLGEKDFQQCMVIQQLMKQTGMDISLITCPTLREDSGLAKSSRNARLSPEALEKAALIYSCLNHIKEKKNEAPFPVLREEAMHILHQNGFDTEYLELAESATLRLLDDFSATQSMILLIATRLEGVRLIDNLRV
ncbi:MAG: pantoate--beta-alanine ligase [Chitinophagaceae bacterium]|nr:pantoate--beta-alanine ligase [Chitinophagaceae bacterium]